MHRVFFEVSTVDVWYSIMQEARTFFAKEWKCQSHVKRKLSKLGTDPVTVWFDVPDPAFGTWVAVKLAVTLVTPPNK